MASERLAGKRVLVAGVGPGLGTATAVLAAQEGASVHLAARRAEAMEDAVRHVAALGGAAEAHRSDLADAAAVRRLFDDATARGPLDAVLVTAGGWRAGSLEETDADGLSAMLAANVATHAAVVAEAGRRLSAGASIATVSAVFGVAFATEGQIAYNACKAAAWALARSAALELLGRGIRVNCVLPGGMRHDFEPNRDHRAMRKLGDVTAPPEDVAKLLVWLASDDAAWVTGAAIPVDGGLHLAR